jgi:hemolysin activation/secretion protein
MPGFRPLAWLLLLLAGGAAAQDLSLPQRYAPQPPPEAPGVAHPSPPPLPDPAHDTTPLVPSLKAIVLVASPDAVQPQFQEQGQEQGYKASGLQSHLPDAPDPAALEQLARAYLGKPLSLAGISQLGRDLIAFWRAHDRPVMDVVVPEQDITSGVLQLIVLESRVGAIRVEGNHASYWSRPAALAAPLRVHPGDRMRGSILNADLDWLNGSPFRRVQLVYTPGATPGTTDLVLKTEERLPLRVYLSYDDTGAEPLPHREWLRNRWQAGFNWGDALGLNRLLSYQFTTSDDFTNVRAHALSYSVPLPWRHLVTFSASYSESETTTGATLLHGTGWGSSLRYSVPLPGNDHFRHSLALGPDFSRSDSNLDFGGFTQYTQPVEVRQGSISYQATLEDRLGLTSLEANLAVSPGNGTPANSDARLALARAAADSSYQFTRWTLERLTRLPQQWSFLTRATLQWASGPLIAGEAFYLGGRDSVRGYESGDTHGDQGVLLTAELHTPPVRLASVSWLRSTAPPTAQGIAFIDYGRAEVLQPLAYEPRFNERAGAGLGLRITLGRSCQLQGDYAWQLLDPFPSTVSQSYAGRAHLGFTLSY